MDWDRYWKEVHDPFHRLENPRGWIQWKGTNVCIDLHCKCGEHGHFDGDFLYYWECPKCKTLYALPGVTDLVELNQEQAEFVRKDRPTVIKTTEPEEY